MLTINAIDGHLGPQCALHCSPETRENVLNKQEALAGKVNIVPMQVC